MGYVFYVNKELYVTESFDDILLIVEQYLGYQITDIIRDHIQYISLDKDESIEEALDILRSIDAKRIRGDCLEEAITLLENATA